MTIGSQHYAELSDAAYDIPPPDKDGNRVLNLDGVKYHVLEVADNRSSGYQGVVFQREGSNEIVVAHRGTEFTREFIDDVLRADGGMVGQRANQQAQDALEFTRKAMERAGEQGVPITVTGHSLGGCLAQVTAAKLGLQGETFNAYGAADLNMRIPEGGHQVVNHVMAADFVSSGSHHFGEVRVYASRHDINTLSVAGYANNDARLTDERNLPVALASGALSHSLHNFRDAGPGQTKDISVLRDPETRVNAHRFEPMIDKFRGDIWATREGASIGSAVLRGPMGIAEEIGRRLPEKTPESPFKDAHGAVPAPESRVPDPRHPDHPNHSMHSTLDAGVGRVFAEQGRPLDATAERTTAALLVSSRLAGLEQVNHVVPGRNTPAGTDVFAVQGELHDPAHKRAHVNTVIAAQIPVEVSFQKLAAADQRVALAQEQSQEQTRSQTPRTV
ncbi:XVIPCD domain-containing protein [Lysobacter gummosus]|uniref:Thioesterase domain-containing protein n=1 Tax=Lysobacter gummosus TaxID=262324 RepID=A0ABY3XB81_9GAMM|nr:XVIPCD domain-containing protein [Lysobacter gummosus]ALN89144.1 lipase family protein [Lysobacter gummosus]UNP29848.1 thioesterase domain-containing protein [Lysobacter gummosus]